MSARDELEQDIRSSMPFSKDRESIVHHVAKWLHQDGYRKPRTITTEAELESLPVGSVIWAFDYQTGDSNSWQLFDDVLNLRDEEGDLAKKAWESSAYKDEHASNRILLRTHGHPITVLREGEQA